MKLNLNDVAFETTRRCNLVCHHCMRGPGQNMDMSPKFIDAFFERNDIEYINHICFSGGEPTLNPEIIAYTIEKIINEKKAVGSVSTVTNGQIFSKEIVDAFNRFNQYRNRQSIDEIPKKYQICSEDTIRKLIKDNTDNHARITFSKDQYHKEVPSKIEELYLQESQGLKITSTPYLEQEKIYKTGNATFGRDFDYQLDQLRYYEEKESYVVFDLLYLTASGYITTEGMGTYQDMDQINTGHVSNVTIPEILVDYGTPIFKTKKLTRDDIKR